MDDASSFDRTKQALHFIGFDQQVHITWLSLSLSLPLSLRVYHTLSIYLSLMDPRCVLNHLPLKFFALY
jgi:hypothetical protein